MLPQAIERLAAVERVDQRVLAQHHLIHLVHQLRIVDDEYFPWLHGALPEVPIYQGSVAETGPARAFQGSAQRGRASQRQGSQDSLCRDGARFRPRRPPAGRAHPGGRSRPAPLCALALAARPGPAGAPAHGGLLRLQHPRRGDEPGRAPRVRPPVAAADRRADRVRHLLRRLGHDHQPADHGRAGAGSPCSRSSSTPSGWPRPASSPPAPGGGSPTAASSTGRRSCSWCARETRWGSTTSPTSPGRGCGWSTPIR